MTITIKDTSLKNALTRANPNSLSSMLTSMGFGAVVRALPTTLRGKAPLAAAAYPYIVQAAAGAIPLPDDAKAHTIFRAYARAGTGTPAELTVDAPGVATAPAAGHCSVSPSGDLQFASADAWTSVDVVYLPEKVDVFEVTLPVVSGILTLPTVVAGNPAVNVLLMEAEALAGTTTGKFQVLAPGAAPGTTKQANFATSKLTVLFRVADAVSSARVKYGVASAIDLDALLTATSIFQ